MDFKEIVSSLRNENSFYKQCTEEEDILLKCILCKKYLSSNKWGIVLESFIKTKFGITPSSDRLSGDGVFYGKNIEIKVSLGTSDGQFNFVQLRPGHNIDYYLFLAYDMFVGDIGKVHWFICPAKELYELIPKYGGYAHGSIENLGKITIENLYRENIEYCIRPNSIKSTITKQRKLWELLIEKFEVDEYYIHSFLNQ